MTTTHLEILVEELSMEAFLKEFLPRLLPAKITYSLHSHNGKTDLLKKLPGRLSAYSKWMPDFYGIVVVVDRDADDCLALKEQLEESFVNAGIGTRRNPVLGSYNSVTTIAIEELEAWYFGNWGAVKRAYPNMKPSIPNRARYRSSDAIVGGTWEAFEKLCIARGYFLTGLRKIEAARDVGRQISIGENCSPSFRFFCDGLLDLLS